MRHLIGWLARAIAFLSQPVWCLLGFVSGIALLWIPPVGKRLLVGAMFAVHGTWPAWYFRPLYRLEKWSVGL